MWVYNIILYLDGCMLEMHAYNTDCEFQKPEYVALQIKQHKL